VISAAIAMPAVRAIPATAPTRALKCLFIENSFYAGEKTPAG
jgi:hypothetical protein